MPLVFLGSARQAGDTHRLVARVLADIPHTLVELLDWPVVPYNYQNDYPAADAFQQVAEFMLGHQVIVFATPVYWYSMSGVMKQFFDRFTNLTDMQKQLGRQLAGKHAFLLAVGSDRELPEGFEVPFRRTAEYFKMTFEGSLYQSLKQPFPEEEARQFAHQLSALC
ncbi:NAD(P)H-dependent oxidoreductase [Hymenobacter tibetensis]|uniref:NAD(P)H-dependent oxidoreductase n=1 Tax=Hymenobacter tibetensis TaxID=497967 RepID=A0ABY4CUA2_9BACT|nr:NAD(P)H-dependent oxidoreductase [Hymenobacter tibetensis]UOG73622.1 NAD(P)H-dependent oxidoreductase [Hymenobacter tibetensis]